MELEDKKVIPATIFHSFTNNQADSVEIIFFFGLCWKKFTANEKNNSPSIF